MTKPFARLLVKREQEEFDDEYVQLAGDYGEAHPFSEAPEVFLGAYELFHGDAMRAMAYAQKAFSKRPLNFEVWKLFVRCCKALGDVQSLAYFEGLCKKFYNVPLDLEFYEGPVGDVQMNLLSLGLGIGNYAPFARARVRTEGGKFQSGRDLYVGEFWPRFYARSEYWFWVGCYEEREDLEAKSWIAEQGRGNADFVNRCGAEFVFDTMKAQEVRDVTIEPDGAPVLVPLAGKTAGQFVQFAKGDGSPLGLGDDDTSALGKWSFDFYRVEQPTRIMAMTETPFVLGAPVELRHSPRRHPVVLNILVDTLSWSLVRDRGYRDVPNILRFFSQGVIFDQNFSTSEYTFPSFVAIESGMYPHHNQIFNEQAGYELAPEYVTISEQMKKLGYYCANLLGMNEGLCTGAARGFDRIIGNGYCTPAYLGVERAIRQLDAFDECDQYLLLHTMDVHVWSARTYHLPLSTQTKLPLEKRLAGGNSSDASVYIAGYDVYRDAHLAGIRATDRSLGVLFDYLETHYAPGDYVVNLYSDHGASVFDDAPYLLSDHHVGSALMARGAGIPARGIVRDEITSSLDLYAILAKEAGFEVPETADSNLPAALGGQARRYAISNTLYPGQVYRCAIRTLDHEFQMKTHEFVDEDGTVDMRSIDTELYRRNRSDFPGGHERIEDAALQEEFLGVLRAHTAGIDRGGDQWPSMREARPEWFGTAERKERRGGKEEA